MQQNEPTPGQALVYETALRDLAEFAERRGVPASERDRIQAALLERVEAGRAKYGTYLMTFNGRDALQDAWEEAADLMFYLQQEAMEDPEVDMSLAQEAARALVLFLSLAVPDGA